MECNRQKFLSFGTSFYPFSPPNNQENQNFEKMKKTTRDITILHLYTTNDDHMLYGSQDMEHNRHIFLSFWTSFCLLPPPPPPPSPNNPKMKETPGDIITLHMSAKNHDHTLNCS